MTLTTVLAAGGAVVVAAVAAAVYRDATRVGVELGSPALWAALVACSGGASLITAVLVPDAPLPGVLVLTVLGPLLYALEREDSTHGPDAADPTRLPSQSGERGDPDDERD